MNTRHLFAMAALALFSRAAAAEGFAGVAGGASDFTRDVCTNASSCDRSGNAWSARAGWMFMPRLGIEARYTDLGRANATYGGGSALGAGGQMVPFPIDSRFEARASGVGAVLAWPVGGAVSLTGVAGLARTKVTVDTPDVTIQTGTGSVTSLGLRNSTTKTEPYYGVGVDYRFAPNLSVGIEATRQRLDGGGDIDMLAASLTYRFR